MPEPALHIWEPEFIQLWEQGASYKAIAQALRCPLGTVASRAAALAAQGKITPRQRGGVYPNRRAKARQENPPAPPVAPAPPAITFMAVPEIQELLSLVKDLHARVGALEQTRVPPRSTRTPTTPAPPAVERKDIQQWTVCLSKALIEHLKAVGYERRIPPSQLVEELLWTALTDRRSAAPE
jgi:hypothetical protein